jgi:hypothetical protein
MDATLDGPARSSDGATEAAAPEDAAPEASTLPDASDAGPIVDASDAGLDAAPDVGPVDAAMAVGVFLFDGHADGAATGGRSGTDALCATAATALADGGAPLAHVRAFLSVSSADEIRDMPANYGLPTDRPIGSVGGAIVAVDWSHLLGGTLLESLDAAGIRTGGQGWFSGSNPDGSVATSVTEAGVHDYTCSGWTSPNGFLDGEYGLGGASSSTWIAVGQATCGVGGYSLLCVGWN